LSVLIYANHNKMSQMPRDTFATTEQKKKHNAVEIITGIINGKLFDVDNLFTSNSSTSLFTSMLVAIFERADR